MHTDDRISRQNRIISLINSEKIDSQERLLDRLAAEGLNLTQATLSRDLKSLKVIKLPDSSGNYYYAPAGRAGEDNSDSKYAQDFLRGYISLAFSGNICVIKTWSSHADSTAYALDRMAFPEVLGTVAGDDTIITVLKEGISHEDFRRALQKRMKNIRLQEQ
jgi:transcriptional regulator of arginine metabolism